MGRIASSLDPTEIVGIKRSANKKAYYAQTRDGRSRQLRSVTAALAVIGKDEALMRWAIGLYSKCLREIAPTGQVLTPDALEAMIEQGANEFERVRYDAAEVGTRAHNLISDWLLCRNMPPLEAEDPRVQNALRLFWAWWEDKGLRVVDSELAIFNAQHGYAGTLDFICELPTGKIAIVELKTAKGLYPENYMQAAAYYFGLTSMPEEFGGRAKEEIAETTLLRIGKEDAYFEPAPIPLNILPAAYKGFYCCLQLLDAIATINEIERVRWREHKKHIEALAAQKVEAPF